MTVDEAIICLSDMKIKVAIPKAAVQARLNNEALDMAIEALKCSEIPNSSDVISRQAAIDALRKMQTYKLFAGDDMLLIDQAEAQTELMMLPSAQPESKELSEWKADFKGYINALILPKDDYEGIIEYIDEVPHAQPERKKGKWIYNSPVTMKCDQCGLVIKDWDWHRFKNCPNCLADMRGEKK